MSPKTDTLRKSVFKVILPLAVIISGVLIMTALVKQRPEPGKESRKYQGMLVRAVEVKKENAEIIISGTGTVQAAEEIPVIPQVEGRVVFLDPKLAAGGFFKKGDVLFKIEDTDYRLALERAMAEKTKAEFELATIESQAQIARDEWERISSGSGDPPNPLVLFEPQLKNAKAAVAAASSFIEQARLDLERTTVTAPFNGRISSKSIGPGQFVKPGNTAATLAGTDTAEINVPFSLDDIQWLNDPFNGSTISGLPATALLSAGGKAYSWQGQVVRSTGEVDPKTRMMQLVVEIKDPYGIISGKAESRPPLAAGTFVDIKIRGTLLKDITFIPRTAFRENSTVWIIDENSRLVIKNVNAARIEKDRVIVSGGLENGDRVVLSNISGAADGMKLRLIEEEK